MGSVSFYDERRGLGRVVDDGGTTYDFHATAIADGTRRIAAGARVCFTVGAGHRGRFEARGLTALGAGAMPDARPHAVPSED